MLGKHVNGDGQLVSSDETDRCGYREEEPGNQSVFLLEPETDLGQF